MGSRGCGFRMYGRSSAPKPPLFARFKHCDRRGDAKRLQILGALSQSDSIIRMQTAAEREESATNLQSPKATGRNNTQKRNSARTREACTHSPKPPKSSRSELWAWIPPPPPAWDNRGWLVVDAALEAGRAPVLGFGALGGRRF